MATITNFYEQKPASGGKAKQMVMLLHGLGADGQDLISLAPLWAQDLPDAVFVSPDAPFPCDMAPFGYQWFSLQDRDPAKMLKGVQTAAPILSKFIDEQLKKHDVPAGKLALVGFSQGTMMSLYVGPRYKPPIAGILGYSGALLWETDLSDQTINKVPVHLVHGDADEIVPVMAYHHALSLLSSHGFLITGGVTRGLPHSIDESGMQGGGAFLKKILV